MATIPKKLTLEVNLPDEVLIEILLRLPLLSLQLFKSVSKHWLSLITSEYFIGRLRKPRLETPCGLFILERDSEYYDFVSLGPRVTSYPLRATIAEARRGFAILRSCNGLYLCRNFVSHRFSYYVYNPFTKLFKNIPFKREQGSNNMILAFDPTKSPYYKVVTTEENVHKWNWGVWEQDREQDIDTKQILIYSSETGKWRICGPTFHKDMFWGIKGGIYWNNAIHWIRFVDNGLPLHSKLDIVDHLVVTDIQTPVLDDLRFTMLSESRGTLLLLMEDYDCCYHVFQMREESFGWSVKYIVNDIVPCRRLRSRVVCIVLAQREDDSFMVIKSDNEIVLYNFMSKTVSKIFSVMSSRHIFDCAPFIASLAGV